MKKAVTIIVLITMMMIMRDCRIWCCCCLVRERGGKTNKLHMDKHLLLLFEHCEDIFTCWLCFVFTQSCVPTIFNINISLINCSNPQEVTLFWSKNQGYCLISVLLREWLHHVSVVLCCCAATPGTAVFFFCQKMLFCDAKEQFISLTGIRTNLLFDPSMST